MIYLLIVPAYLLVFWYAYILVMGIYRAYLSKRLQGIALFLCAPAVVLGVVMDVIANLVLAPFVFLEIPREWLVTQRLSRHIQNGIGTWRGRLAAAVCDNLLDVFDPTGNHC